MQRGFAESEKAEVNKDCFVPFEVAFADEAVYRKDKGNVVIDGKKEVDVKQWMEADGSGEEEGDDEEEQDVFSDYLQRIALDKTQCVRYCYGDAPLLPCAMAWRDNVPECEHCGRRKVFECQVMSATLNYLEPKQIHHEWLTVLLFVCPLTCELVDEAHVIVCCEP